MLANPGTVDQRLLEEALDALPYSIVILDNNLEIVAVNDGWVDFGQDNGANKPDSRGISYATICEKTTGAAAATATAVLQGLREILNNPTGRLQVDYECSSPTQRRWFTMTGARAGKHIIMVHRETTLERMTTSSRDTVPPAIMALLAGDESPNFIPVDIGELVASAVPSLGGEKGPLLARQDMWAMADAPLLLKAFQELLGRAGDALDMVSVDHDDDHIIITLRDTAPPGPWAGFGIGPYDWKSWDGGLGLPYARAVMQIHDGQLFVWEGDGTVVNLLLPKIDSDSMRAASKSMREMVQP